MYQPHLYQLRLYQLHLRRQRGFAHDEEDDMRSDPPSSKRAPIGPVARIVQTGFLLVIVAWLVYAVPTTGDEFPYDLRLVAALFQLASSAVCAWLIGRRAVVARRAVMVASVGNAVLLVAGFATRTPIIPSLGTQGPELALVSAPLLAAGVAVCAAVLVYFEKSSRMREALVTTLERTPEENAERLAAAHAADIHRSGRAARPWRTWTWWRNLVIHYCAFTILGHWGEMAFCQLIRFGIVAGGYDAANHMLWDQWLYPFPAEGIAIVFIVVALHPLKEWLIDRCGGRRAPALVLSFLANALVCTGIDLTTGLTANADYHLWDYSDLPFNFMGQICLQNSLTYTVAATVIVWCIYPAMERLVHKRPEAVMDTLFVGLAAAYAFLELIYVVNLGPAGVILG